MSLKDFNPTSWYIVALMTVSLLVTGFGWNSTHKNLKLERDAHAQTVQTFKDQQAEADRKAEEKRKELKKENEQALKDADATYDSLYDDYLDSLLRLKTYQSSRKGPSGSKSKAAQGGDGSRTSSEILEGRTDEIIISFEDGKICAVNTARLQAVREWALKLPK